MGTFQNTTNNILGRISQAMIYNKKMNDLKAKELEKQKKSTLQRMGQGNLKSQQSINAKVYQKEALNERINAVKEKRSTLSNEDAHQLLSRINMDRRKLKRYKRKLNENDKLKKGVDV